MLQQTQVTRVEPVFRRFVEMFPTPAELAEAPFAEVVVAWGDLGYLRRARNLQAAARQIVDAGWPTDLTDLAGVGPYTAAAVSAFADDAPVAAVDVNVRRILSRWTGTVLSTADAGVVGRTTLSPGRAGDWNQAMMDLGARLCRPRIPRCSECPVRSWCTAPSLDLPVRRQTALDGSIRQARAAVLKRLAVNDDAVDGLIRATGLAPDTVQQAVEALVSEGTVVEDRDRLSLG
ncbi:MAG: A/G-specific adenine glycosylase [Acidimicrobiia bacterium]